MIFQFQVLGFIILFILVISYYMGCDKYRKKEKSFKYLLLVTYINQLLYICTYIAIQMSHQEILYGKLYLISVLAIYIGYIYYYLSNAIKEKYQGTLLKTNNNKLKWGLIAFNIFHTLIIFASNFNIISDKINYQAPIFMYFIIFYLIIGGIILLSTTKQIHPRKTFHLWIIYLISILAIVLQNTLPNLPIINIGIVLITLYLYITLENLDTKELEILKLERDYNAKQNIDKVAFLKNISHEIRTPINTIDGFSQIILESNDIEEIKNDISDIRLASKDLMDAINGMIDLSIIESGELQIIYENYNVYEMLENIINITNSKLKDKKVELETNISEDIPEILSGDSERISQVILNILKNSIKYTEEGTIKFQIETIKSKTTCRLKITIEDTGKGMKLEDLENIFNQNQEERKGLGLVVSKYLIDLMGGSLETSSIYGKGTKTIITLDQKIISEKQSETSNKKRTIKPFSAEGKRILIVDDNKLNVKVAKKLLDPYKVEIEEASSGKECLDIMDKDTKFDLILMDDLMPEMSGSETMNILKKIQRVDGFYIPVVVVTANAISGQKEKYLEMGFDDYLSKPIERYELDRVLKKYLKGKK